MERRSVASRRSFCHALPLLPRMTMASNRPPNIALPLPSSSSTSPASRRRQLRQFYVAETTHDTIGRPRPTSSSKGSSHRKAGRPTRTRSGTRNANKSAAGQIHHTTRHDTSTKESAESEEAPSSGSASAPRPSLSTDESFQAQRFDEVICADHIDMDALREVSWNGIPHQHRAQAWQHLLGYLPLKSDRRAATLKRKRSEYRSYVEQHFDSSGDYSGRTIEERKMIHQIQVDCPRTEPNLPFFKTEAVQRSLERTLITWSYRNPATGHVQGMVGVHKMMAVNKWRLANTILTNHCSEDCICFARARISTLNALISFLTLSPMILVYLLILMFSTTVILSE